MRWPKPIIRLLGRVHRPLYRLTGGRLFGSVGPARVLLLTTTGRRSGKARTVPLLYVPDGECFVIVASQGGHDTHPAWYLNLTADPNASIQIGGEVVAVSAEELGVDDRERLWRSLVAAYPDYAEYRTRTRRQFPIIALRPTGSPKTA